MSTPPPPLCEDQNAEGIYEPDIRSASDLPLTPATPAAVGLTIDHHNLLGRKTSSKDNRLKLEPVINQPVSLQQAVAFGSHVENRSSTSYSEAPSPEPDRGKVSIREAASVGPPVLHGNHTAAAPEGITFQTSLDAPTSPKAPFKGSSESGGAPGGHSTSAPVSSLAQLKSGCVRLTCHYPSASTKVSMHGVALEACILDHACWKLCPSSCKDMHATSLMRMPSFMHLPRMRVRAINNLSLGLSARAC
jgi:hypothetical protein